MVTALLGLTAAADLAAQQQVQAQGQRTHRGDADHRQPAQQVGVGGGGAGAAGQRRALAAHQAVGVAPDRLRHQTALAGALRVRLAHACRPALEAGHGERAVAYARLDLRLDLLQPLLLRGVALQQRGQLLQPRRQRALARPEIGQVFAAVQQQEAAQRGIAVGEVQLQAVDLGNDPVAALHRGRIGEKALAAHQHAATDAQQQQQGQRHAIAVDRGGGHGVGQWEEGRPRAPCTAPRSQAQGAMQVSGRTARRVTASPSAGPAAPPRCGCRPRACRSPRTGSCAPCPTTAPTAWRCRRPRRPRRPDAAPGARGR
ncbi:hypothetical protein NB706_003560 [Xanthomonas sacchari]|nr:hypothetical protein [Xanthomonas sacchari]